MGGSSVIDATLRCTLTTREFTFAAGVGVRRQIENLAKGRQDSYGADPANGWNLHVEGACAEAALAKALNRWWSGNLGDLTAADVGPIQVRSTWREQGRLPVHPGDPDDDAFVLAIGSAPSFAFPGWIRGALAKQARYWCDPTGAGRPAYFVPQSDLLPMEWLERGEPMQPNNLDIVRRVVASGAEAER